MEKKQTAVEWLIEKIDNKDMGEIPIWIYDFCYDALEMEKEQILEFGSKVTERWGMCKVEPHFIKDEFDKIYKY